MTRRQRQRRNQKKSPARSAGRLRILLLILLVPLTLAAGGLLWLWPRCAGAECPSVDALRDYAPPQATRVFDAEGEVIAHLAPERRIVVPLERIPSHLAGAFLAVEDKRFFQHGGVDYRRVAGAALRDLRTLSFEEGFSTLTMQLARNVFPEHLTRAKTLRRKLWEVMLAREIEREFSKDEILEMYLNQIYLGDGLYGVEAAAQGYFGKPARELDAPEAALLAALPQAPSRYNPRRNPEVADARRDVVLARMADAGVISEREASEGKAEPLALAPPIEASGTAPYLVAAVRRELRERFGPDAETAGLRVYTALDTELQRSAETALREQIAATEAGQFGRFRHPSCSGGKAGAGDGCLQSLFVAMDPRTGDVRALVGGRDFAGSQFDRATQARRQAGSAFKPIVYATGLAAGIPTSTVLLGPGADDWEGDYRPADHVADSIGVDLREGLRSSSNRAAVALGEQAGVGRVVQTARALGLSTPIQEYPSTFLGAADVIPIELIAAYGAFANGGVVVEPRLIQKVENPQGELLWEQPVRAEQAIPANVAYLTLDLMKDVVNRGTGFGVRRAGLPYAVPAAGKTGTTNEAADVWFIGATPDLVAGVWFGFDRPARITHGASGGSIAAPVWGEVMADYYGRHPAPTDWAAPTDLVTVAIDRNSGLLATSRCPAEDVETEMFIPGAEPIEHCPLHPEPGIERWFRRTLRGLGDLLGGRPDSAKVP